MHFQGQLSVVSMSDDDSSTAYSESVSSVGDLGVGLLPPPLLPVSVESQLAAGAIGQHVEALQATYVVVELRSVSPGPREAF